MTKPWSKWSFNATVKPQCSQLDGTSGLLFVSHREVEFHGLCEGCPVTYCMGLKAASRSLLPQSSWPDRNLKANSNPSCLRGPKLAPGPRALEAMAAKSGSFRQKPKQFIPQKGIPFEAWKPENEVTALTWGMGACQTSCILFALWNTTC